MPDAEEYNAIDSVPTGRSKKRNTEEATVRELTNPRRIKERLGRARVVIGVSASKRGDKKRKPDRMVQALIDTGASASFASESFAKSGEWERIKVPPTRIISPLADGGKDCVSTEAIRVYVGDGQRKIDLIIAPSVRHELVIGMPDLRTARASLSIDDPAELLGIGRGAKVPRNVEPNRIMSKLLHEQNRRTVAAEAREPEPKMEQRCTEGYAAIVEAIVKPELDKNGKIDENSRITHWSVRDGIHLEVRGGDPVAVPPIKLSYDRQLAMEAHLKEALRKGEIAPQSEQQGVAVWQMPYLLLAKKDADGMVVGYRPIMDCRGLNARLLKVTGVPTQPSVDDTLRQVTPFHVASKCDISGAFQQVAVHRDSQHYLGFAVETTQGIRRFVKTVLPQGAAISSGLFQFMMTAILDGIFDDLRHSRCLIYIDDVYVFTWRTGDESEEEIMRNHGAAMARVVRKLTEYNVRLKMEKCLLAYERIVVLGWLIGRNGRTVHPSRVQALQHWRFPKTVRQLRKQVGMLRYIAEAIPELSRIIRPLTEISIAKGRLGVTQRMLDAWEAARQAVEDHVALSLPDPRLPYTIASDASGDTIAAVLMQVEGDKPLRFISFRSQTLPKAAQGWAIGRSELFALVRACEWFKPFIVGRPVRALVDHQSLVSILSVKPGKQTRDAYQIFRYLDVLSEVSFVAVEFVASSDNIADVFTRLFAPNRRAGGGDAGDGYNNNNNNNNNDSNDDDQGAGGAADGAAVARMDAGGVAGEGELATRDNGGAVAHVGAGGVADEEVVARGDGGDRGAGGAGGVADEEVVARGDGNDRGAGGVADEEVVARGDGGDRGAGGAGGVADEEVVARGDGDDRGAGGVADEEVVARGDGGAQDAKNKMNHKQEALNVLHASRDIKNAKQYSQYAKEVLDKEDMGGVEQRQKDLLVKIHEQLGHVGANALTAELLDQGYWWPNAGKMAAWVTGNCVGCLRRATRKAGFAPMRLASNKSSVPWTEISLDHGFYGGVPIFVARCRFTRFIYAAIVKNTAAKTSAVAFMKMCALMGLPRIVSTDNATSWKAEFTKVLEEFGIKHIHSTPNNSRANGMVEDGVKQAKDTLARIMAEAGREEYDVSALLPYAVFGLNSQKNAATKATPFAAMFGRSGVASGRAAVAVPSDGNEVDWTGWADIHEAVWPSLLENIKEYGAKVKGRWDESKPRHKVKQGDAVFVSRKARGNTVAYTANNAGPYFVVDVSPTGLVSMVDDDGELQRPWTSDKLIHAPQMEPLPEEQIAWHREQLGFNDAPPLTVEHMDEEQKRETYDIDAILEHKEGRRKRIDKTQYLVHWEGYGDEDNQWVKYDGMYCKDMVIEYWYELYHKARYGATPNVLNAKSEENNKLKAEIVELRRKLNAAEARLNQLKAGRPLRRRD
eukprot:TRINITY_DN67335_c7_g1_i1.p1 TRINITY_DN67335_c7_g1~~TRINITY_DN67335_c7_g1_i1.p1  ORF type:complete len:1522 (+),score=629.97 TRINITY_DN67335_c7_g1_i1:347-4567(+)